MEERCFAFCYLKKHGDGANTIAFFETYLSVTTMGRPWNIPYRQLTFVGIDHKKALFPILAGVMMFVVGLASVMQGLFDFWYSLMALLLGMIGAMYGFIGRETLSVTYGGKSLDVFIEFSVDKIKEAIKFCNQNLRESDGEIRLRPIFIFLEQDFNSNQTSVPLYPIHQKSNLEHLKFSILDLSKNQLPVFIDYEHGAVLRANLSSIANKDLF